MLSLPLLVGQRPERRTDARVLRPAELLQHSVQSKAQRVDAIDHVL